MRMLVFREFVVLGIPASPNTLEWGKTLGRRKVEIRKP
jgi:hypothetical protein